MKKFKGLDGIVNIIVLTKLDNRYNWFCSDKVFWIMDYVKYTHQFDPTDNDYSERFDIGILDEKTAAHFLENMEEYSCSIEELKSLFAASLPLTSFDEAYHLFPKLFVDFDSKKLLSVYSEALMLENYAPEGWSSKYGTFTDDIPTEQKYWVINGVDYEHELFQ
ncbi:hypothetical protein [Rurimicrobium arvi]|uniref:Immunity protein 42 n=1 Tax=Rurimicrobium arvi TaxID=2049916 RepID=A0ABP8MZJ5_9BACT